MAFSAPPVRFFAKSLIGTIVVIVIGFVLMSTVFSGKMDTSSAWYTGLILGALLGGLFSGIGEGSSSDANSPPKSIFVGNLNFKATDRDLRELFAAHGNVQSVRIMMDRATRRPRGFAFVEMPEKDADKAIRRLDGTEFMGRKLRVNEGTDNRKSNPQKEAA